MVDKAFKKISKGDLKLIYNLSYLPPLLRYQEKEVKKTAKNLKKNR